MKYITVAIVVLAAVLGGCTTPSLNRLSSEETLTMDPGLVGQWEEEDGGDTYVVSAADERTYRLVGIPDDGDEGTLEFALRLVKLGEHSFIELTLTEAARKAEGEKYGTAVIPGYVFMKVLREGDSLRVWQLEDDWLTEGLEKGTHKLAFAKTDNDGFVLTANTQQLQEFFRSNAANEEAFQKPTLLRRSRQDPK